MGDSTRLNRPNDPNSLQLLTIACLWPRLRFATSYRRFLAATDTEAGSAGSTPHDPRVTAQQSVASQGKPAVA